ncbi:hypothetical protein WR25_12298 isoform A [Diploscapter pachys]|uniref:Chitin-binding type-2 domain-containing protein n=1 Tax=Diploscapter pachys TaxID=2018661 RepID=A0A2A2JVE0_9BILA|nr:hypothetical protein WR25_12298 isoform A [Diploscapter pachys]
MAVQRILTLATIIAVAAADDKSGDETPQYWRAILGDICQLPSFPRATGDPNRYVECVRQSSFSADRKDLGIWLLRECLPGYEFVASARRCKTVRSVKRQQELCESANATDYQFCPTISTSQFLVEEIREAPRQCSCPNGENNCVCPSPEILEPTVVQFNSEKVRRAPQKIQFSQYPSCPCPQQQPQCTCVTQNAKNEQVLASTQCCPQQQPAPSNPCQCQQPPANNNCQTTTTQQQYCPQQQQPVIQPQPCPLVQGGVQNAQYQGICSWMIDPLATDPQSCTHYLQCQPAPNNLFCGRWQRMPCAPATVFDVSSQVCVWDTNGQPGSLPTPAPYVSTQAPQNSQCSCTGGVQIGSCNQNYQCPGQSVCQVGQQNGSQVRQLSAYLNQSFL